MGANRLSDGIITPHHAKRLRSELQRMHRELRQTLRRVRELRETGRQLALEEAEALLVMAWHDRKAWRAARAQLSTVKVEKYANVSPAAAARLRSAKGR